MTTNASKAATLAGTTYNLSGQRLGRKGQETRKRIIAAMEYLLEEEAAPVTLSAIARHAGLGMSTLYLYFPDLGDLLLAVLDRAMDEGDQEFVQYLRDRWPDEDLADSALIFVRAYFDFWRRHAPLLRMRNSFADAGDKRLVRYRYETTMPLIGLLVQQMDADNTPDSLYRNCAGVLLTGLERIATIVMSPYSPESGVPRDPHQPRDDLERTAVAQAKILETVMRASRAAAWQAGRPQADGPEPSGAV